MRRPLSTFLRAHEPLLSEDRIERLREIIEDAQSCRKITDWERGFLEDLEERLDRFGTRTRLSDAQQAVLENIEEKIYDE